MGRTGIGTEGVATMAATAIQAHRGSPDPEVGIRENTLDAFLRARDLGADGVELDVRMTSDGGLAVHHDPVVEGIGTVSGLAAVDLPSYVPLLSEVLDVCRGLALNIEIKNLPGEPGFDPTDLVAREVAELVVASGWESSAVVSSFWPDTLEAVAYAQPDLSTGLLLAPWFDPQEAVTTAVARGCRAVHPHIDLVTESLIDQAHGAGLSVAAWTVNDRSTLEAAGRAGVDTVITDDVGLALGTLRP